MKLQYPMELEGESLLTDYITFQPAKYRSNASRSGNFTFGGSTGTAGAPADAGAHTVVLYMPNSTPSVGNSQNWQQANFPGPAGAARRDLTSSAVNALMDLGNNQKINDSSIVDDMTAQFKNAKTNMGGIGKQVALQAAKGMMPATPNQMLALSRGEVYNPNVELLYSAPIMRHFGFDFKFVPKNAKEALVVNEIIRNFKYWSAPEENGAGMFEVPYIWQVTYMTGGAANRNMNKFKKAALQSVIVQANPSTDMHVSHAQGMPVETALSLQFNEIDIITRKDHLDGGQGY